MPLIATRASAAYGSGFGAVTGTAFQVYGAYDALATVIVPSGGADSVTFDGIPSGYRHLQIRYVARTSRAEADDGFLIQFNGIDSSTYYRYHYLAGTGSAASSYTEQTTGIAIPYVAAANASASTFGIGICDILDYSNPNKNTTARIIGGEDRNGGGWVALNSGAWFDKSPVVSIRLKTGALGDFVQNSHFALYGVK